MHITFCPSVHIDGVAGATEIRLNRRFFLRDPVNTRILFSCGRNKQHAPFFTVTSSPAPSSSSGTAQTQTQSYCLHLVQACPSHREHRQHEICRVSPTGDPPIAFGPSLVRVVLSDRLQTDPRTHLDVQSTAVIFNG